jgi:hypothetical protein
VPLDGFFRSDILVCRQCGPITIVPKPLREFNEAYLPTEPAQASKDPRFSQAYEHGRGA